MYTIKPLMSITSTNRPLPYIDRFVWALNDRSYNTIGIIFHLPQPITSLNGPFKVGPMVGRLREVLLHIYACCVNIYGLFSEKVVQKCNMIV